MFLVSLGRGKAILRPAPFERADPPLYPNHSLASSPDLMPSVRPLTYYAWLSIAAAVSTFALKLGAWWLTDSVGLLSDALESLVNLAAAILALVSLKVAARPADDDHAYGHHKVEYFSSGVEGALIVLAAIGIGWNAVDRLLHPEPLHSIGGGLVVAAIASIINLLVALKLRSVGKARHSVTLRADAQHLMVDVWTTAAVMGAVTLATVTSWWWLDAGVGLLLAVQIIWMGVRLVRESMMGLMDTGLPPDEMETIRTILNSFAPQGVEYHALRTRQAGAWRFMSVHVLVPGEWSVNKGHQMVERIEDEISSAVGRITILTHLEPNDDPSSWEDIGLKRSRPGEPDSGTIEMGSK